MSLTLAVLLITNVVNVSFLSFVLKKKISEFTLSLVAFTGSIIFLIAWSVSNYFADTSTDVGDALFWTRATFPPSLLMCWFVFLFSNVFPEPKRKIWIAISYLLFVCAGSVASMSTYIVGEVFIESGIGISDVTVGTGYVYIVLLYLTLIFHATYNFASVYKNSVGIQKLQMKSVLIGWSVFLTFAVMTNAVLPLITGHADWSKFGPLGSVIMVAYLSYAIVRYGLMDIKVIVQRGLIYSILLALIVSVYIASLFVFEYIFHRSNETTTILSAFVTTLIGIFGVPPLTKFFQKKTAHFFFKDAYDYAEVLEALADVLNKNIAQESIIKKSSEILERSLKAERVLYILTPEMAMPKGVFELQIPITSDKKSIGMLLFGQKRSGDPYTKEDVRLLETFSNQAAVALEKASLFKQVKEYAETLEKKVEERTAEIVSIQKEQEAMMLEISHGLQTPLTIMKGELYFLRKKGTETEKIDTIDTSIDRISTFIYKLLSMYRMEVSSRFENTQILLNDLICSEVASFKESIKTRKISLWTDIEKSDVYIEGDKDGIQEVLSNLISNAIKYSSKDRENIVTVSLTQTEKDAVITVSDTGIGIQEMYLPNLFTKFFRVKDEVTKGIQGTGLGLAVCKKLVEAHGGAICATSIHGEGTTFTVTLPKIIQSGLNKSICMKN